MAKKYLTLNDISAYKKALKLSNYVWEIIIKWNWLAKRTIGVQFTRSVDSISSNLAEGFGRYHKKDKVKFYRYSFGSIIESLDWNEKAKERDLLKNSEYKYILEELKKLPKEINHLIHFTNERLKV